MVLSVGCFRKLLQVEHNDGREPRLLRVPVEQHMGLFSLEMRIFQQSCYQQTVVTLCSGILRTP